MLPCLNQPRKNTCTAHGKTYAQPVKTVSATAARAELYRLIDATLVDHQPVQITGKRGNAVLVSSDDWRAIQETLHLLGIPGMRESIRRGMDEPLAKCSREIDL